MEDRKGKRFMIVNEAKASKNYFKKKYGVENPIIEIEDTQINVIGKSWMDCNGNPACLLYAMRSGFSKLPTDNNVWYGKINHLGELVHESELKNIEG